MEQEAKILFFKPNTAASYHFMKKDIAIFSKFDVSSTRYKPVKWAGINDQGCDFFN